MAFDPLVEKIVTKLIDPDNDITLPDLRAASFACVMCVFERKVDPDFFFDVLDIFKQIVQQEAIMTCGSKLYEVLKGMDPDREPEKLKEGMEAAVEEVQKLRGQMLEKMKLIAECPGPEDKIS